LAEVPVDTEALALAASLEVFPLLVASLVEVPVDTEALVLVVLLDPLAESLEVFQV